MNKRAKEIAGQALDKAVSYTWTTLNYEQIQELLACHAKLIVQECINKIETYQIPVGNSAAGEMACEWTYDALKEIRDDIKETFGVE